MLIIKTGTNIDKSYANELFTFGDLMHESEIVAKLEELAKELDLFNPEVQLTIATNRDLVIETLRVLALESGRFDQFRIEYDNLDGTKSIQSHDKNGNLNHAKDDYRDVTCDIAFRALTHTTFDQN